jgi:hypothetical protein
MPLTTRPQCTPAPPTGWLGWLLTLLGGAAAIAGSVAWYLHAAPVGPGSARPVGAGPIALRQPVPLMAGKVIEPDDPPAPAPASVDD